MKHLKSFKLFLESVQNITYDNIISDYVESNDKTRSYKWKWLVTSFLNYIIKSKNSKETASLETLSKYSKELFSEANLNLIESYYNSEWIKFLDIKLPEKKYKDGTLSVVKTYPDLIGYLSKMRMGKDFNFEKFSMFTTNIGKFIEILSELNTLLPKEVRFYYSGYNTLTKIDDKNLLKALFYFKDKILTKEQIIKYSEDIQRLNKYAEDSEVKFIKYLKDKRGLESHKPNMRDDFAGIDVVDENGTTYQVKFPSIAYFYRTGDIMVPDNKLDTSKILNVDKLAVYNKQKDDFVILDTESLKIDIIDGKIYFKNMF